MFAKLSLVLSVCQLVACMAIITVWFYIKAKHPYSYPSEVYLENGKQLFLSTVINDWLPKFYIGVGVINVGVLLCAVVYGNNVKRALKLIGIVVGVTIIVLIAMAVTPVTSGA